MISAALLCLATNIYFEARNEPLEGQVAVSHVVLNRVASSDYPNSICQVVTQKHNKTCQFSWHCDGKSDRMANKKARLRSLSLANSILTGRYSDNTGGALNYHADYIKPYWASSLTFTKKIGTHLFYKP